MMTMLTIPVVLLALLHLPTPASSGATGEPLNRQKRLMRLTGNNLWPKSHSGIVLVPYVFDDSIDEDKKSKTIFPAFKDFVDHTCIRWVPRSNQENYVEFNGNKPECSSPLGMTGGKQTFYLSKTGCGSKSTVLHEMLHAMGFMHEHVRSDRTLRVQWGNIREGDDLWFEDTNKLIEWQPNLGKEDTGGYPHDFYSIMHYGATWMANSDDGRKTMTTGDDALDKILGTTKDMSPQDIDQVNYFYDCKANSRGDPITIQGPNGKFGPAK